MSAATRIRVEVGRTAYDVRIGQGLLAQTGQALRELGAEGRIPVVTDEHVAPLHLGPVAAALRSAGLEPCAIVLPAGEASKSFRMLETLVGRLLDAGVTRDTPVVALGGGVVGDLAGFAAAIVKRGLPLVQVPTTLLAMVDLSVGGKTAIDMPQGKNLVGAFHQPALVLADVDTLATLPARERRAGYAEVVKYGLMADAAFFAWLETHGARVLGGEPAALVHAIATGVAMKAAVVARDPLERTGERMLLNLGHTFGHALEAEAGFGPDLLHGEAVAIGMAQAFRFSVRRGLAPAADAARVEAHLAAAGLPVRRPRPADRLVAHMAHDKKRGAGGLPLILVRGIGRAFVARDVPLEEVRAFLAEEEVFA